MSGMVTPAISWEHPGLGMWVIPWPSARPCRSLRKCRPQCAVEALLTCVWSRLCLQALLVNQQRGIVSLSPVWMLEVSLQSSFSRYLFLFGCDGSAMVHLFIGQRVLLCEKHGCLRFLGRSVLPVWCWLGLCASEAPQ